MSRYSDAHSAGKAMPSGGADKVYETIYGGGSAGGAVTGEYRSATLTNVIAQMDQTAEQIDGLISRLRQLTDKLQDTPAAAGTTGLAGRDKLPPSPTTLPTLAARSETIYKLVSYGHDVVTELEKML